MYPHYSLYALQSARVFWNGTLSDSFPLTNGVKQGAVLSAILYCVYMNGLFELLRKRSSGCWIEENFLGMIGYADDSFLLSPTLDGLQEMLLTCEEYAKEHNLFFSTNPCPKKRKTKCIAYLKNERTLRKLKLCGNDLPWWDNCKHLGNKIQNVSNGMKQDVLEKRAKYISKNMELNQEFSFAHPDSKFLVNQIYNNHFTGSPLWNLFSREAEMLENSFNCSFRNMYDLPRESHRYLVEAVTEKQHLRATLIKRFLSFTEQIKKSSKVALKNLFNTIKEDTQSVTGNNLRRIMLLVNKNCVDELNASDANNIVYAKIPENEEWRVELVKEITDIKFGEKHLDNFPQEELNELLKYACTT